MLKLRFARVGGHHSCMGGRREQKWWQVEYPVAQGQEPGQHRQDVALHSKPTLLSFIYEMLISRS